MDILVIGGTEFVGRHIVERALLLGHRITVFHRGQHGIDLYPSARHILGNRDGELDALGDEKWDAVIDTCGYVPRIVKQSVEKLKGRTNAYLFISTISVYAEPAQPGLTESGPLAKLEDETTEVVDAQTYGGLKVLCEQAVTEAFGDKGVIVRPGMIVGPYDKTDRFTYWFRRAGKGGKMLSVCERDEPLQFIDGRDLAAFCIHLLSEFVVGTFNATGPQFSMTWGDIFDEAALAAGTEYEIVRPSEEWLKEQNVTISKAFPGQFPATGGFDALYQISVEKAVENGLRFRPLTDTIRDTLVWRDAIPDPLKVGLTDEEEARLLEAYG